MSYSEEAYKMALTRIDGVGPVLARNLISYCGGVEAVFESSFGKLKKVPGIGDVLARNIANAEVLGDAERDLEKMRKADVRFLFFLDSDYPHRLRHCHDSPLLLYYKGSADLNKKRSVAIVGTRNCTRYGEEVTEHILKELASYDPLIVSGMAYGIDIAAHRAALRHGLETVGVFAHGLDMVYPGTHRATAQKMLSQGGLLTEFPFNTNPDRENFPSRNRVVAGIVDLVIVVESAVSGGALITAEIASSYDREVFAVPGPVFSSKSRGCHAFIRKNKAICFESVKHLADEMNWNEEGKEEEKSQQMALFDASEGEEKVLIDILRNGPILIDDIVEKSGMDAGLVASKLLEMEFSGLVRSLPGKVFKLNGY